MGFAKEFKDFALKGNVVDLAVAVIIGAAFGKIVTSMVSDLVMPLVGFLFGGSSFADKFIILKAGAENMGPYTSLVDAQAAGANVFAYGSFLQTVVDFLIVAIFIFLAIKGMNAMKKKEEAAPAPAAPSSTDTLLMEIRDELKKN